MEWSVVCPTISRNHPHSLFFKSGSKHYLHNLYYHLFPLQLHDRAWLCPLLCPPTHKHRPTQMKHLAHLAFGSGFCMVSLQLSLPCGTHALVCGLPKLTHFTFFLFCPPACREQHTLTSELLSNLLRAAVCVVWVCCASILVLTFDQLAAIVLCPSSLMTSYSHCKGCSHYRHTIIAWKTHLFRQQYVQFPYKDTFNHEVHCTGWCFPIHNHSLCLQLLQLGHLMWLSIYIHSINFIFRARAATAKSTETLLKL